MNGKNLKILYECDPQKNAVCKKTDCVFNRALAIPGECHSTFDRRYARLDGSGQPIVIAIFEKRIVKGWCNLFFGGEK